MAFTYVPYEKKQYQQGSSVTQAQQALQQHQQNKPGEYQSQWQNQMNDLLAQYQNRGPFQYDINADAMYQQMVDRYVQQGKQAMMDTMGQAAALTGGYGNSYAQTAGQQTYQGYLQGVNDLLPQFYQMALDRYQMEGDDLLNQYGLLSDQENAAYNRYVDQLNQYYAELDRLQGVYESERDYDYGRFQDDQNFDYGQYMDETNLNYQLSRDQVSDDQWAQQWAYQQERDRIADEQWQKEFDESVRQYNESMAWQREQASKSSTRSSGGGGGGRSSGGSGGYYNAAAEYVQLRQAGASTKEQNQYLNQAVADGVISQEDAKQLKIDYISGYTGKVQDMINKYEK